MLHLPTIFPPVWFIPGSVIDLFRHPWIHLHLLHLSFWVLSIWRLWAHVQIQLINGGASDPWVSTFVKFLDETSKYLGKNTENQGIQNQTRLKGDMQSFGLSIAICGWSIKLQVTWGLAFLFIYNFIFLYCWSYFT